ncbi:ArnT family glycosyltransferase [Sphingomonas sp. XXL09]|uniref:ArnT family glycosyltransferase n=1 Tax=Sphingomonas sp. XXL09 TaxID=3457787 RepID=UPI00406BB76D
MTAVPSSAPAAAPPRSGGAIVFLWLLAAAVAIRCRDFGNPVIHVDEQYYLLVGSRMLQGAVPYIDLWDRKPVGLFLIFAGIRLIPGDPILVYQLVATLFAAATAWLVTAGGRRLGATPAGALAAGVAYILWLSLLSGRGGQSPVFYNLFTAAAAVLTLRLPDLARRARVGAIVVNGSAACLLAGLAIQTKYTPVVEGAFFGLVHLWYGRRAGGSLLQVVGAALLWAALGLMPTLLVILAYYWRGPEVFAAFWFSNFASIALRRGYPAAKIAARLAGTGAQLLPFLLCAIVAWRRRPRTDATLIAFGWLAAALVAFAMIGAFFDHYALPLMIPLAMVAAPVLGRHRGAIVALLAYGLILFVARVAFVPTDAQSARAVAQVMRRYDGDGCPFVFAGDSVLYLLADACTPTPYAFPSTLAYEPERGATGIDEAAEVGRILARRPPVIVTMDEPFAPWNADSERQVAAALRADYRLVLQAPREDGHLLAYVRRDRLAVR